jgi:L-asparaginase/Glu-tRNA(Gln) amidotransferase subunit D
MLDENKDKFYVNKIKEKHVTVLKFYPGMPDILIKQSLQKPIVGIVLEVK